MLCSKRISRAFQIGFATLSFVLLGATPLQAELITWNLTWVFSGATPDGTLTVKLEDTATNTVQLTVDTTEVPPNPLDTEFVSELCLNLDPAFNPNTLSFAGPGFTYVKLLSLGTDAFKPDGDGKYDIEFSFYTSAEKPRLDDDKQAVFTITRSTGLSAASFKFPSAPAPGGSGPFLVAAHVQGIDHEEGSGWVTRGDGDHPIPEASTMLLFGSGLTGVLAVARRKIRF